MKWSKKRIWIASAAGAVALAAFGTGGVYGAGVIARNNSIGELAAKNFAYMDAEVSSEEVENSEVHFGFSGGHYVYEVDFTANGTKYEYEVLASDGRILERDATDEGGAATDQQLADVEIPTGTEWSDDTEPGSLSEYGVRVTPGTDEAGAEQDSETKTQTSYISVDEAKTIILRQLKKSSGVSEKDVTFLKMELSREDGSAVYTCAALVKEELHSFAVDAATGEWMEVIQEPSVNHMTDVEIHKDGSTTTHYYTSRDGEGYWTGDDDDDDDDNDNDDDVDDDDDDDDDRDD